MIKLDRIEKLLEKQVSLITDNELKRNNPPFLVSPETLKDINEYKLKLVERVGRRNWVGDAIVRDEHGGTGKETAKIIEDDIIEIIREI